MNSHTERDKNMKRSQAFPSKYLSKDDVMPPIVAVIKTVVMETLDAEAGETKPVMYFQDAVPPLVVNTTNWMSVEDMYGPESDDWAGHSIELYQEPNVTYGGKRVGGIRIRKPAATATADGLTPKQRWIQFIQASGASSAHIRAALGTEKVSEWLAADSARTLADAMGLVEQALGDF